MYEPCRGMNERSEIVVSGGTEKKAYTRDVLESAHKSPNLGHGCRKVNEVKRGDHLVGRLPSKIEEH